MNLNRAPTIFVIVWTTLILSASLAIMLWPAFSRQDCLSTYPTFPGESGRMILWGVDQFLACSSDNETKIFFAQALAILVIVGGTIVGLLSVKLLELFVTDNS
jgi:hypothetical protein